MALKKIFVVLLLALVLGCLAHDTMASGSSYCDSKCAVRCSKAGLQKRCLKYCGICCDKCRCVPSGTYGHKDECPCYRNMKNSKGTSKCP